MKIPKWDPRSRRGMFIGVSPTHASTVGNSINLRTGNVSYHLFTTLPNEYTGGILDDMPFTPQSWSKIVESGLDEAESGTTLIPSLDREWLSDEELPPTSTRHSHYDDHPTLLSPLSILRFIQYHLSIFRLLQHHRHHVHSPQREMLLPLLLAIRNLLLHTY
jgi:hypothetical protein